MDSWPLWVQWALLFLLAGTYLGCSWWLAFAGARASGDGPATWSVKVRRFVSSLAFADWALIALFVAFLIPLVIRTIAGA